MYGFCERWQRPAAAAAAAAFSCGIPPLICSGTGSQGPELSKGQASR